MATDATGDAPNRPEHADFRPAVKDYLRRLGKENRSRVKNARRMAARCVLGGVTLSGACIAIGAVAPSAVSGDPAPLTLTETWNSGAGTILNDAPCGVAEASPVEFNDGGSAGVE